MAAVFLWMTVTVRAPWYLVFKSEDDIFSAGVLNRDIFTTQIQQMTSISQENKGGLWIMTCNRRVKAKTGPKLCQGFAVS